jgi:hypothetical protein
VQGITVRVRPQLAPALRPAFGPPAGAIGYRRGRYSPS